MTEASEAALFARLVKPFPVARLDKALWYVETTACAIRNRKYELLINQPFDPVRWSGELELLKTDLEVLAEQCEQAWERLDLMVKSSDADYERGLLAVTRMLQGIGAVTPLAEAA